MLVSLMLFAVLGGGTAFGLLYVLGYFPNEDNGPPDSSPAVAANDSADTNRNGSRPEDGTFRRLDGSATDTTSETSANDGNSGGDTSTEQTENDTPGPLVPLTNPDGSPDSTTVAFPEQSGLDANREILEVNPFDRSVAVTAELYDLVQAEIQILLDARRTLGKTLDERVIALATEGKIDDIQTLQRAKELVLRTGDTSELEQLPDDTVTEARETYRTAIAESQQRLLTGYNRAIERAESSGQEQLQASLIYERDAGFELSSQSWIMVFRSSDPHRWNTVFDNGEEFAIDVSAVPATVQSLRLRRMDTGETVVIPFHSGMLADDSKDLPGTVGLGWIGNHDSRDARKLGIFRSVQEFADNRSDLVTISGKYNRRFTGWGFGLSGHRRDRPQGFAWNGEPIGPTIFEIAVSNLAISEISPFTLRADAPGSALSMPTELPADDPIVVELEQAKEQHAIAIDAARQDVLEVFAELLKELGEQGDADGIAALAAARTEFTEGDAVARPSSKLRPELTTFYGEITRADEALNKEHSRAIAAFERAGRNELATLVGKELETGVGYEADRWMVLLRSPDPRLWATHSRGPFRFSRPLTDAPADTQFLRMQVIPVRATSRSKKLDPVYIEMSRDRIATQSVVNGFGWDGLCRDTNGACQLGIYLPDKRIEFPVPREARGLVSVSNDGFDVHLGWGFGRIIHIDKGQGYSWAGWTSTVPLQIEIAVSDRPLRENEWKLLLGGGAKTP